MPRNKYRSAIFATGNAFIRNLFVSAILVTLPATFAFGQTPNANTTQASPTTTPSPTPAPLEEAIVLKPNQPIEKQIKGGEVHAFHIKMKENQTARTEVVQKGIDVIVSLYGPDGKLIVEMNSLIWGLWKQRITALSSKNPGVYKLKIRNIALSNDSGSYQIKVVRLSDTNETDLIDFDAEKEFLDGTELSKQGRDFTDSAIKKFERCVTFWRKSQDKEWENITHFVIAVALLRKKNLKSLQVE